jgi:hypothetical protein
VFAPECWTLPPLVAVLRRSHHFERHTLAETSNDAECVGRQLQAQNAT